MNRRDFLKTLAGGTALATGVIAFGASSITFSGVSLGSEGPRLWAVQVPDGADGLTIVATGPEVESVSVRGQPASRLPFSEIARA